MQMCQANSYMVRLISCHIHLLVDPKHEMTSDTLTSLGRHENELETQLADL